jgi:hypothetical protein
MFLIYIVMSTRNFYDHCVSNQSLKQSMSPLKYTFNLDKYSHVDKRWGDNKNFSDLVALESDLQGLGKKNCEEKVPHCNTKECRISRDVNVELRTPYIHERGYVGEDTLHVSNIGNKHRAVGCIQGYDQSGTRGLAAI